MKRILLLAVAAFAAISVFAQNYEHSVGVVAGGLNGLSYKYFISEDLAIQADLAVGLTSTSGSAMKAVKLTYKSLGDIEDRVTMNLSASLWAFELAPNFVYQKNITSTDWCDLDFFVGGGFTLGYAKLISGRIKSVEYAEYIKGVETDKEKYETNEPLGFEDAALDFGKFGINAIGGVEMAFKGAPITLGIDFRPGYGLLFAGNDKEYKERQEEYKELFNAEYSETPLTYNFFDWTLAATVRYTF
jgi:hypothetical protein